MDRLHVNAGGNWDDHLWTASLKPLIEALPSDLRKKIDTQYVSLFFYAFCFTSFKFYVQGKAISSLARPKSFQ